MRAFMVSTLLTVTSLAALPLPVSTQVAARPSLTLEGARRVIAAAVADARAKNAPGGVIAVVDDGGHLIAVERLDHTFAAGANISIGKARTAALFKKPTRVFEEIIRNGRTAMVALDDFTPLQGGVPLIVDDEVVGGVGVSGAASAQQDEELAIAGAAALLPAPRPTGARAPIDSRPSSAHATAPSAAVEYFASDAVRASFAQGAVLLGPDGRNYQVHTSRRTSAGLAEVHARETDIIYVQSGAATIVTGGTIVEPKATGPDEVRGASVQGGARRHLGPGDVIVIPSGTPHWFQAVDRSIEYYVVKVGAPVTGGPR